MPKASVLGIRAGGRDGAGGATGGRRLVPERGTLVASPVVVLVRSKAAVTVSGREGEKVTATLQVIVPSAQAAG